MYLLVNGALADAFISGWSLKYEVNLIRPVTYIQLYQRRNWEPYIQTPPFPEYPSGHSVASGAAAEVLTTMFGQVAFIDRTPILNGHENMQRSFTSFEAAASEAAISRMYGGIHYRAAIENGLRQGRCVGQSMLNNIRLRSIPQNEG
jgi:membrane-associated phospholipid phosphatase